MQLLQHNSDQKQTTIVVKSEDMKSDETAVPPVRTLADILSNSPGGENDNSVLQTQTVTLPKMSTLSPLSGTSNKAEAIAADKQAINAFKVYCPEISQERYFCPVCIKNPSDYPRGASDENTKIPGWFRRPTELRRHVQCRQHQFDYK